MAAAEKRAAARRAPPEPTAKRALLGWILFDWAAQPFYTLVVTFLFAPYFVNVFMDDPARGSSLWAYATGVGEFIAAAIAPVLGAIAWVWLLDPHFGRVSAEGKREAWFQDQYCHPHESCHTLDEVLGWLEENNLEFVNAIPKPAGSRQLTADERLFEPKDRGTPASRVWSQLRSLSSGYREGGFFIVIARRR